MSDILLPYHSSSILSSTAGSLPERFKKGRSGSSEVRSFVTDRKDGTGQIGAFLQIDREGALAPAEAEQGIRSGKYQGPFAGVPAAVKDNICTKGMETTCASRILSGFTRPMMPVR